MSNRCVEVANGIDDLHRHEYRFWFDDSRLRLILDAYIEVERETKRHGWQDMRAWRLRWNRGTNINREDIVIPDEIRQLALEEFVKRITIE